MERLESITWEPGDEAVIVSRNPSRPLYTDTAVHEVSAGGEVKTRQGRIFGPDGYEIRKFSNDDFGRDFLIEQNDAIYNHMERRDLIRRIRQFSRKLRPLSNAELRKVVDAIRRVETGIDD